MTEASTTALVQDSATALIEQFYGVMPVVIPIVISFAVFYLGYRWVRSVL